MAFVLQQSWRDNGRAQWTGSSPILDALLAGRDLRLGKGVGTILTVLLHILLLWVFATRLAVSPEREAQPKRAPGAGVVSLTLAPPAPAAAAAARTPPAVVPPAPEVDVSAPSELSPPEWTVSRIASASPARGAPFPAPASASGTVGGGVYDPYAGAAPTLHPGGLVRDASVNGLVPLGSEEGLRLNEELFAQVRAGLARAHPRARGTVELSLRVSNEGVVLGAEAKGGSAASVVRPALVSSVLGKRLFLGSASSTIELHLVLSI